MVLNNLVGGDFKLEIPNTPDCTVLTLLSTSHNHETKRMT